MVKRLLFFLAIVLAVVVAVALFAGSKLGTPVQVRVGAPPADLNARSIDFPSKSGATVKGWWCPVPGSGVSVLLLPAIRANRLSMVERARFFRRIGYSVLLVDLQGTGETPGAHITFGAKESHDALAAVGFLRKISPTSKQVALGSSLGGAAALLAEPPLPVDALILEAVYPTIERATANRLRKYLGPAGPLLTPLLTLQLRPRLGVDSTQLRPVDHIAKISCPVLIINGARDRNTTPDDAKLLYARAHAPKELWLVPEAGHVDLHQVAREDYEGHIQAFLGLIQALHQP